MKHAIAAIAFTACLSACTPFATTAPPLDSAAPDSAATGNGDATFVTDTGMTGSGDATLIADAGTTPSAEAGLCSDAALTSGSAQDRYTAPASCSAVRGTPTNAGNADAFRMLATRRWLDCERISALGDDLDVGLEITADGHWYALEQAADGTVVRTGNPNLSGTVDLRYYEAGSAQVDLESCYGTYIVHATFWSSPLRMELNNEGVFVGEYVAEGQ